MRSMPAKNGTKAFFLDASPRKAIRTCPCWILLIFVGVVLYFTGYFHTITIENRTVTSDQLDVHNDEKPGSAASPTPSAGGDQTNTSTPVKQGHDHQNISQKVDQVPSKMIYLFTYYRSGSTLLGEFFNQNDQAFYWFEPLAGINESLAESYTHVNTDGTLKILKPAMLKYFRQTLDSIYSCDLESVPTSVYKHRFMTSRTWLKSSKMQDYFKCFQSKKGNKNYMQPMMDCRHHLINNCKSSSIKVVKDIRLPMSVLEEMLKTHPQMKVIFQTRDPRGQLNSLWPATSKTPNLPLDARFLCNHVLSDYKSYLDLVEKYPGSIQWLRYEDMVKDPPMKIMKLVYDFVGLSAPKNLQQWLWDNMHAVKDGNAISTSRRNATKTAYKWQEKLSSQQIKLINDECKELIDILGYSL